MVGSEFAAEDQVFTSAEVCRIAKISSRQLQWWDERHVVSPGRKAGRRTYRARDVLQVLIVAALRGKGLSLQRIRRVLRLLRKDLDQRLDEYAGRDARLYLVTDCQAVHLDDDAHVVIERLAEARRPMYLISLSDQLQRIHAERLYPSRDSRQLPLF